MGANVVKWAGRREEIYNGRYKERLPDILFELNGDYGVGMDLYTSPVTINYTHRKISGGHKREAVLLTSGNDDNIKNIQRPGSLVNLKDFILKLLSLQ